MTDNKAATEQRVMDTIKTIRHAHSDPQFAGQCYSCPFVANPPAGAGSKELS